MANVVADRIKESTTTTGTGTLVLGGALTGFRTFSSVCANGDRVAYEIHAVDTGGAPTGAWEVGFGVWGTGGSLSRVEVVASSNAGAAVNFAAGTKLVSLTVPAALAQPLRRGLLGGINYYVRADGNDANAGTENTAGGAFLTLQKAISVAIDEAFTGSGGGSDININVGAGTFAGAWAGSGVGNGYINIIGAGAASTTIAATGSHGLSVYGAGPQWSIGSVRIETAVSGFGVQAVAGASVDIVDLEFGDCAEGYVHCYRGGTAYVANVDLAGDTVDGFVFDSGGTIELGGTVDAVAALAVSGAFAACRRGLGHLHAAGATFANPSNVTGQRYNVAGNGVIWTNGGGASFIPGNSAGATTTGGQYL